MARIVMVEFDEEEQPQWITMRLSLEEVGLIALITGKYTPAVVNNNILKDGYPAAESLHDAATAGVFNRWFYAGVKDWAKDRLPD